MDLRRMAAALREDLRLFQERGGVSRSTTTAATLSVDLVAALKDATTSANTMAKLAGSLENLGPDERRQLAATYKELRTQNTRESAILAKLGAILLVKDLVSMPAGSTGYS